MSGVIGPNRYVPGQVASYAGTEPCDDCDQPATFMMIGETDSFGSEVSHYCTQHMLEHQQANREARAETETCEFCGAVTEDCEPFRDPEESYGPVYTVCLACRVAANKRFAETIEPDEDDPMPSDLDEDDGVPLYDGSDEDDD